MYEYIKGKITELTPAFAILEAYGVGYFINISLNSYTQFQNKETVIVYIHQAIREDAHVLFGFSDKQERELFRLLISVSGVGPNTARMMLSSLPAVELASAIKNDDVNALKSVKGIGAKSAQRIIIDLKDKLESILGDQEFVAQSDNTLKNEALSALEVLGFAKKPTEKAVEKLIMTQPTITLEALIKQALKVL